MNPYFNEINGKFGFGCMRLPMIGEEIDRDECCKMVDAFLEQGFNYFDTAHGYHSGKSEIAVKDCLTSRYPRDRYLLTDKLTGNYFETEADIRPFFQSQLDICGVEYFDFYLMHAQNEQVYAKFKACRAYETGFALKEEGKVRHVGLSFHDKAELLDRILTDYPQVEVVQLQLNYVDYDDPIVQGRQCMEVCKKHGKPVIVMEPVKGGNLVNLPEDAQAVLDELNSGSNASLAIRYAASFDEVMMVLSGMSNLSQMEENLSCMKDFKPLSDTERAALEKVCEIFRDKDLIPCTSCRYCTDGCPQKILIPDLFACMNGKKMFSGGNHWFYYNMVYTANNGKASDCIECGLCEASCPQHLPIRALLKEVAATFEAPAN